MASLGLCDYYLVGCGERWHEVEVDHARCVCRFLGSVTATIISLSIELRRFKCEHGGTFCDGFVSSSLRF